jgi:hypothetical protein
LRRSLDDLAGACAAERNGCAAERNGCAAERNGCAAERINRRKVDSLARRAGGRLRSLGRGSGLVSVVASVLSVSAVVKAAGHLHRQF